MLHVKFQDNQTSGSGDNVLWFLLHMGMAAMLVM